jgi:hypothetical protein
LEALVGFIGRVLRGRCLDNAMLGTLLIST